MTKRIIQKPKLTKRTKPARSTKATQLTTLLASKKPCTLAQLSEQLDWQPHTTRAAISRLRKNGVDVETLKGMGGGRTTYRIGCAASKAAS